MNLMKRLIWECFLVCGNAILRKKAAPEALARSLVAVCGQPRTHMVTIGFGDDSLIPRLVSLVRKRFSVPRLTIHFYHRSIWTRSYSTRNLGFDGMCSASLTISQDRFMRTGL